MKPVIKWPSARTRSQLLFRKSYKQIVSFESDRHRKSHSSPKRSSNQALCQYKMWFVDEVRLRRRSLKRAHTHHFVL